MFYGLSMHPEYFKQRINLFVALAPVVKLGTNKSARFRMISFLGNSFVNMFAKRGVYEAFGKGWDKQYGYIRKLVPAANEVMIRTDMINYDLDSNERTKMLMGHFPHGTSTRSLNHFGQLVKSNQFQFFDYGKKQNIEFYGQEKPPLIPIENIPKSEVPIALFSG